MIEWWTTISIHTGNYHKYYQKMECHELCIRLLKFILMNRLLFPVIYSFLCLKNHLFEVFINSSIHGSLTKRLKVKTLSVIVYGSFT